VDRKFELRLGRQQNADVGERRPDRYGPKRQALFRSGQRVERLPGDHFQNGHDVFLVHRVTVERGVSSEYEFLFRFYVRATVNR